MPITITSPGSYTVVPGETYIIDPDLSGWVNFNAPPGAGQADFTVNIDQSMAGSATINFNGSNTGGTLSPTVNVAESVDASGLKFNMSAATENYGNFTYNLGDGSSIGTLVGANGPDADVTQTIITGGNNVSIQGIDGGKAQTEIVLGDNANLLTTVNSGAGGMSFTAGDNLTAVDFNMPMSHPNYSVVAGDNADIRHIFMGGGYGDKNVVLGDGAKTGDISIGGSGLRDDHMKINIDIGNNAFIGANGAGNIGLGGSYVDRTIKFGDNVHVEGLLGMGGTNGINNVTIGDGYRQDGYFTGSTSGVDTVVIGNDWQFNSTFTLQGGDDSLVIGSTTRDTTGGIRGGTGIDALTIVVAPEDQIAFDAAAQAAGWTQNSDGSYNTNGGALTWKGNSYSQWETARSIPCFVRGTQILGIDGEVAIEELRIGDWVMTKDNGPQKIRWIGSRILSAEELQQHPKLRPIRISAGALGEGKPRSDLLVSPQHRVLVRSKIAQRMFNTSEVLVAAKQLLLLDGFDVVEADASVEYFHILFDQHEVVMSNGAETESLYTGPEALKSVGQSAKEEIFSLFPELAQEGYAPTAIRPLLSGRQGRKMGMRHLQNHVPLVS